MAIEYSAPTSRKRAHQSEQEEPLRRIRRVKANGKNIYSGRPSSLLQPEVRKRPREPESPSTTSPVESATKKVCLSETIPSCTEHAIEHWRRSGSWPDEYFEPDIMSNIFAQPSLKRRRSEAGSLASASTPSDQRSREEKTAPYKDPKYDTLLEMKGVHMGISTKSITPRSKEWCSTLLKTEQTVPDGSVFQDGSFTKLFNNIKGRNEARIVQDIARLIVPSAESLYILGAEDLAYLVESVNDGWNNAIPLIGPRPQPDYSVGFNRTAFSDRQNEKLAPYIGNYPSTYQSHFMATWYMHFPFLASEVKCGSGGLEVADRQNAHSMTLAVRAVVELFREVKRGEEINMEILAFSVSHDSQNVRLYGHFPVIDGASVSYHRHMIDSFDLTVGEGEKRWTAYKFIANVYKRWVPKHLERLHSAIDALPHKTDCGSAEATQKTETSQGSSTQLESFTAKAVPASDSHGTLEAGPPTPDTSVSEQASSKGQRA